MKKFIRKANLTEHDLQPKETPNKNPEEIPSEGIGTLESCSLTTLQGMARDRKILGWARMRAETLVRRLTQASQATSR